MERKPYAGPRCGHEKKIGDGQRGGASKAPCDRPLGHSGCHDSGRVQHNRKGGVIANDKKKLPEHPYAWTNRETGWRWRGILCLPGCVSNRGYLCRDHYRMLWEFQEGNCGKCHAPMYRVKPYPSADHYHQNVDAGPIRGLVHGGTKGGSCNMNLSRFEQGEVIEGEDADRWVESCREYLLNPPARQLARKLGIPFPAGTLFFDPMLLFKQSIIFTEASP